MSSKSERSRNLRWKKPALAELGWWEINEKLDEISNQCYDIHWMYDDDETLINALDGDEEEAFEFKMLFSMLEGEAQQLDECLRELSSYGCCGDDIERRFNDCSVALIGDRFRQVGYDDVEEDYFSLSSYDADVAFSESGKRVMRMTKAEMLSTIGQVLGIILAFKNIELKYEYLKATFEILQDNNVSVLKQVKEIEEAYEAAMAGGAYSDEEKRFDRMASELPDKIWIE